MRDRLHGYTQAQTDRLAFTMFLEMPSEFFVARQLGIGERDVEQALERWCTRISALAQAHWQARLLRQLDEFVTCCDRLTEFDPPSATAVTLRVRAAALRQSLINSAEMPPPAPVPAVPDVAAARCPPTRRIRRLDFAPVHRAGELAAAE